MIRKIFFPAFAGIAAVSALTPGVAAAQPSAPDVDLKITTVEKSGFSQVHQAGNFVITSASDYKAKLGTDPVGIDFSKEVVLAACMGTRNTGGFAIEITNVKQYLIGIRGGQADVTVESTSPAPGSMVPMVITSPIHVVKVNKGPIAFAFIAATPAAPQAFSKLIYSVSGGFMPGGPSSFRLTLSANGTAVFQHNADPAITGKASQAELADIVDAFAKANAPDLNGKFLSAHMIPDAPTFHVEGTAGGKAFSFGGYSFSLGSYQARVSPLLTALSALKERLAAAPKPVSFSKIVYSMSGGFFAGGPNNSELTLGKDGSASLRKATGNPIAGQATQAELAAISDAFAKANAASLDGKNLSPHIIPDAPFFNLTGTVGTKSYHFMGFPMSLGSYETRVRPLLTALNDLRTRLETRDVVGQVSVSGTSVMINVNKSAIYSVQNEPFLSLLKGMAGTRVAAKVRLVKPGMFGADVNVISLSAFNDSATKTVAVRESAAPNAKVVGTVASLGGVEITGDASRFYYEVRLPNGKVGYALKSRLEIGVPPVTTLPVAPTVTSGITAHVGN